MVSRLRKIPGSSLSNPLTPGDLEKAASYWVKVTQHAYFASELKTITGGNKFGKAHPLTRFTAYIDVQGILRVGGRLKFPSLSSDSKQQAILPRESVLTRLVIRQFHLRTLHGGTQLPVQKFSRGIPTYDQIPIGIRQGFPKWAFLVRIQMNPDLKLKSTIE